MNSPSIGAIKTVGDPRIASLHSSIVRKITSTFNGKIQDVNSYFENPNKYGDIIGEISFKYNYTGKYDYDKASVTIDYKTQTLWSPNNRGFVGQKKITPKLVVDFIKKAYKI